MRHSISLAAMAFLTVFAFQNCGKANFSGQSGDSSVSSESVDTSTPVVLPPSNTTVSPVVCAAGQAGTTALQYYPTPCLLDPQLPAQTIGLETDENYQLATGGKTNVFYIDSNTATGTAAASRLYVEFATYLAPDTVVISSVDVNGNETIILDVCNISTYAEADPTNGSQRPYSDTLLQFNVGLPQGSRRLKFDFTNALTPTHLGVYNLGDFSRSLADPKTNPFTAAGLPSTQFRMVSRLPLPLNDNKDTDPGRRLCN